MGDNWNSISLARSKVAETTDKEEACPCLIVDTHVEYVGQITYLGSDDQFGEVSVHKCKRCGRHWLHYLMEYEYLTASGRWFRGVISPDTAATLQPKDATAVFDKLEWYFRGGSAYGGKVLTTRGPLKQWLFPFPGPTK